MSKTMTIHARIEPKLKGEVEHVFEELGLSVSEAITIFFKQVKLRKGLPFAVVMPNATTVETFKATDKKQGLVKCRNTDEMFRDLGI
jgi:DNA-damage-inducible protein J